MAARKLEERLEQIRLLRDRPAVEVIEPLRKYLEDRSNLLVAEAAKIAAELEISSLIPNLLQSFGRLFENPVKTDPKCWGKTAIVKALTTLGYDESPPFLQGLRHIQMEPVWGGQEDAAASLRASSALALVQCTDLRRADALRHLLDALTDSMGPVRTDAVRALEQMNGDEAPLLLRLKARLGDADPLVIGQVFDSLLTLEAGRGVPFVAGFMESSSNMEIRDEACLSLGASRLPAAVDALIAAWRKTKDREFAAVALRSLSSSRDTEALEFLLTLVKEGLSQEAAAAVDALELHKDSPEIQIRLDEAKKARGQA